MSNYSNKSNYSDNYYYINNSNKSNLYELFLFIYLCLLSTTILM